MQSAPPDDHHRWRFVTNHAHVLETIARDPASRLRDIARIVGVTERTAGLIVNDLVAAGYLTKIREGRRNRYDVHEELPLRHPQHRHHTVGELIGLLVAPPQPHARRSRRDRADE
jgi:hypothetical protein